MTEEEVKKFAQSCVDDMSEEEQLHLLACPDFTLDVEGVEGVEIPPAEDLRRAISEILETRDHNYIECTNWHLFSREFMVIADIADMTGDTEEQNRLEDKFEAFNIPWLKYPGSYWSMSDSNWDSNKYGIFFVKVPKRRKEDAKRAFDAYYKWLCWKDPDFKQFCREVMYDLIKGHSTTEE